MKKDIDALLASRGFDAMLVCGAAQHNPDMVYMTGGGHLTHADLIKKRGEEPLLYYQSMERDEAARTGLRTMNYTEFPYDEMLRLAEGDSVQAFALRYQRMLQAAGVTQGRLALMGRGQVGSSYAIFSALQRLMPNLTLVGEAEEAGVLLQARKTKDAAEIERIREMGKITTRVVGEVADYLTSQRLNGDVLVSKDGQPVTIGQVKRLINLWLAEAGVENPEGTIFSIGYDSAIPHSTGTPTDLIRTGKTIVFDIYPCETGGGYFYDFTRTWCLGYAPDETLKIYEDVRNVYQRVYGALCLNTATTFYQTLTCDLFEQLGYLTVRTDPRGMDGYTHSIGHGVGLNVHEMPWMRGENAKEELLRPGMVFTLEPGLYFPEKGIGVRLEDSYWMRPDGEAEVFAPYPNDLILPLRG